MANSKQLLKLTVYFCKVRFYRKFYVISCAYMISCGLYSIHKTLDASFRFTARLVFSVPFVQ